MPSGLYRLIKYRLPGGGIPAGGVAPPSNALSILGRRALPSGRRAPEFGIRSADIGHYSSMIATARTGAAVVFTHLTGKTLSLKPCGGNWSKLVMFSRW